METHHIVVSTPGGEVMFRGSLDECSIEVRKLMISKPETWFVVCKVVPIQVHCGRKSFPDRREMSI